MAVNKPRQAWAAKRRQRRMKRVEHDLTDEQWAALKDAWAGCAYCGSPTQAAPADCVLAISRGGRYTLTNVVPACRSCNASKCNDEVTGWLRRKRLDERAFLVRHLEIRTELEIGFPLEPIDQIVPDVSHPTGDSPTRSASDVKVLRFQSGRPASRGRTYAAVDGTVPPRDDHPDQGRAHRRRGHRPSRGARRQTFPSR